VRSRSPFAHRAYGRCTDEVFTFESAEDAILALV
jgi:hypothetical protein